MLMKYSPERNRYEVTTSYEEYKSGYVDKIKQARFRFTKEPIACWWTDDPERASLLISCADDECKTKLDSLAKNRVVSLELSRAQDATLPKGIIDNIGMEPFPFQRAGIGYALSRKRVIFGDEPGLGKTLQALVTIHVKQAYPCVAVVPASLKINWKKEAQKIVPELREEGAIHIVSGRAKASDTLPPAKLYIINYDILEGWVPALQAVKPKSLIADESHFWKNEKARRTKAGKALAQNIEQRYLLSGTALVNRPKELIPQLDILGVLNERFGGTWKFRFNYCGAKKQYVPIPGRGLTAVWNFDGCTNADELQRKLREYVMVRRLKENVMSELPPKQHQCIELACNGLKPLVDREREIEEDFQRTKGELEAKIEEARNSGNQKTFEEASVQLAKIFDAHFAEMARLAHETALAKLPKVIEFCMELLEGEDKIAVFAHHHDVVFALEKAFQEAGIECVRLTGMDSPKEKDAAVVAFQEGTARVFIGSLKAAGVGLTLTRARRAVFAELDWTPGVMDQAGDRIHRIGQTDSVLLTYIVLEDSLDSKKVGMLIDKRRVLRSVLDDTLESFDVPAGEPVEKTIDPDLPPAHVLSILKRIGIGVDQIPF